MPFFLPKYSAFRQVGFSVSNSSAFGMAAKMEGSGMGGENLQGTPHIMSWLLL